MKPKKKKKKRAAIFNQNKTLAVFAPKEKIDEFEDSLTHSRIEPNKPKPRIDASAFRTANSSSRNAHRIPIADGLSFGLKSETPKHLGESSIGLVLKKRELEAKAKGSSVYTKQELLYVIEQFKEKNKKKDSLIDKLRRKNNELEQKITSIRMRQNFDQKRKTMLPMSHQKNHELEQKLRKSEDEVENLKERMSKSVALLYRSADQLKEKYEETNEQLKQANYCKLFFLSFYKEFEDICNAAPHSPHASLLDRYKLNTINLDMDKVEELVNTNSSFLRDFDIDMARCNDLI